MILSNSQEELLSLQDTGIPVEIVDEVAFRRVQNFYCSINEGFAKMSKLPRDHDGYAVLIYGGKFIALKVNKK
jgi:hypothetical protein